jgi:hypothetical protein
MTWAFIKEVFSLGDLPCSLQEFSEVWLNGKGPLPIRVLMFLFCLDFMDYPKQDDD